MSTFLAIAGVSTTLRNLLLDRMEAPVVVTIAPPDVSISGVTGRRANLYLYQINENAYLKNNAIPFTSGDIASAPLALELSYLITTFGSADNSAISTGRKARPSSARARGHQARPSTSSALSAFIM